MLSMPRLVKLAESGQHDRLLEEILRNGRPLPLAARHRLTSTGGLAVSAISLALSRMIELTHRPTAGSQVLAGKLLSLQEPDGSFGSPAVTASAIEALIALLEQDQLVATGLESGFRERIESVIDQAMHALFVAQEASFAVESATASAGLIGDALETALTLWRLGERAVFDAVIGVSRLRRALAEAQAHSGNAEVASILALSTNPRIASIAA